MLESVIFGYSFFGKFTWNALWSFLVAGVLFSCGNKDSKAAADLGREYSEQLIAQADRVELDNDGPLLNGQAIKGERSPDEYRITYNGSEGPGKGLVVPWFGLWTMTAISFPEGRTLRDSMYLKRRTLW